jgi:hypothetical protein
LKKGFEASGLLLAGIVGILLAAIGTALVLNRDFFETNLITDRAFTTLFVLEHEEKPLGSYILFCNGNTKRASGIEIHGGIGQILTQIDRVDRIDTVYRSGRIAPFIVEVEKLLGISVDYSLVFDMEGLKASVDLLEGVNIFIPDEIYGEDGTRLFLPGQTRLDGDRAVEYVSARNAEDADADFETRRWRLERFFKGLLRRFGEKKTYIETPELNRLFLANVRTNMNGRVLSQLFGELSYIDIDRFNMALIGGNTREVSGKPLLFPYYNGSLIKDIVSQTLNSLARPEGVAARVFTVEVLNGTGVTGLAGRTAELLRGFGYNVVNVGNAPAADHEFTEVIDRSNMKGEAEKFADIIDCKRITLGENAHVVQDGSENYRADFTLIIGRDFNGRNIRS